MGISGRILLLIIAISIVMLGLVDQRVRVKNLEDEIRRNRRWKDTIQAEISNLHIRKLRLEKSERIRRIAESELKMVFPEDAMKQIF